MDIFKVYIFTQKSRAVSYGVGTYLALLCKALKQSNIEFVLVNLYGTGFGVEESYKQDYNVINIPSVKNNIDDKSDQYFSRNVGYLLKEYIKDEDGVKLIFHLNFMTNPTIVDSLKYNFPHSKIVLVAHYTKWSFELMGNEKKLLQIYNKPAMQCTIEEKKIRRDLISDIRMIKKVDKFVCVAKHTLDTFKKIIKIETGKTLVIYNALPDTYHEIPIGKKEKLRRIYKIGIEENLILFVGRLDEIKGINYLIKAFKRVLTQKTNSRLVLIGDGNFNQWLTCSANDWSKITFTGRLNQKQIQDFYTMADIGIVCSLHEEFGLVAIEMMMNKLPIIVSDVGGLNEIIENGYSGLKIHVKNQKGNRVISIKELSDKICKLISDKKYAEFIAQNGRKVFSDKFEGTFFLAKMLDLYKTV